mgnify:CR=1 FL=1
MQGQIRRYLAETPIDRACSLIEQFCAMNDSWFSTKGHDFGTFVENLSKVGLALDVGSNAEPKIDWARIKSELGVTE